MCIKSSSKFLWTVLGYKNVYFQDPHLIHPSTTARNDDHSSRREEDRRNKDHRRNDQLSRSKSPPPIKKRPAIRAPTPEIKEKQRRSEDRCHQNLDEKATRIVIQEEKTLTATSTPTFSGSPSPKLSPKPSPKPSPKDKCKSWWALGVKASSNTFARVI